MYTYQEVYTDLFFDRKPKNIRLVDWSTEKTQADSRY